MIIQMFSHVSINCFLSIAILFHDCCIFVWMMCAKWSLFLSSLFLSYAIINLPLMLFVLECLLHICHRSTTLFNTLSSCLSLLKASLVLLYVFYIFNCNIHKLRKVVWLFCLWHQDLSNHHTLHYQVGKFSISIGA
jgi:hypothetical protein